LFAYNEVMAKTIANLQLDLAYRLGENAVPSSATELAKRRSWFTKALEFILSERPFWFTEIKFTNMATVANQNNYDFPATCRQLTQIKVDSVKYDKAPFDEVYERYERETIFVRPGYLTEKAYYVRGNKFYLIPTPAANGTVIEVWGYENPTMPTAESSGIIVPDNFSDLLVSFAEGRYWSSAHKRAKASDAFGEFTDWVEKLKLENMRRRFGEG
jgi:hypothetical protein